MSLNLTRNNSEDARGGFPFGDLTSVGEVCYAEEVLRRSPSHKRQTRGN